MEGGDLSARTLDVYSGASGAPLLRKFGNLQEGVSSQEILVVTQ